ncbi:putative thiol methyltransferase 2 [Erysiphe neolycopersici]|uniref:Putative thiol methyltransferase 2 n=1 Tax=Erysiphe neolycopersici TaxID=212602 RepID=A0A420HUD4_9PEZI|nr:putative thiol methyltransferase 2 [Erysiphe neolycopersici]
MANQSTDARAKLFNHFSKANSFTEYSKRWDELWKQGFCPWDKGSPNPALIDLLTEQKGLLPQPQKSNRLKALVPGCGKGYDVYLLAAHGYDTFGLEISETALTEARNLEKNVKHTELSQMTDSVKDKGNIEWVAGDFFDIKSLENAGNNGQFDLIYDYTFLCALHPSMRSTWSKRMTELLAPNGRLVCIEFPTYKPHSTGGPPWGLSSEVYEAHLGRPGRELMYDESGLVKDDLGEPECTGLHQIAHFQPKRTHPIGYDKNGEVMDWIGIWAHSV